ncbi:MAG: 50S ribosomal protein L24e [Candidatus Micrarchaeota archaeon]
MVNCSFCDDVVRKGTGVMYIKKDGTLFYFCTTKCRKNTLKLKREGRRQKWTKRARAVKAKK